LYRAPWQSFRQCSKRCLCQTGGQPAALHGCRSRAGAVASRSGGRDAGCARRR
jgi:hypothetical protein